VATYFLDTSGLVKRYVQETGSGWVRGITDRGAGHHLVLARITEVEVVSALVRHQPPPANLALAVAAFQTDCRRRRFRFIALRRAVVFQAARLSSTYRLRSYDAVQLAAAMQTRTQNAGRGMAAPIFVSADHDLNTTATAEGFMVDDPNHHP